MIRWPFGRSPRWHRHAWSMRRVSAPLWDISAKGELWRCSVDGCKTVVAR